MKFLKLMNVLNILKLNLEIFINLMQISEIKKSQIKLVINHLKKILSRNSI